MITESQIEEILKNLFDTIKFPEQPEKLYEPLRYVTRIGGKRIRPRLCLLTYSLFRDDIGPHILEPAAGLEIFHGFTTIHDDIMDKAELRRGMLTVCRKWGSNTAILSGDVMSIDSWRRITMAPAEVLPQVIDLYATTAAQLCEGQQLDIDFETEDNVSMNRYMDMIGRKTAVLIACAAKMGALIGGADQKTCDLLYKFGYDLGLAFQITDDYLDTFGNPEFFGKKPGGDIANNKKTWLLIRAIEKGREMEKAKIIDPAQGKESLLKAMAMPAGTDEAKTAKFNRVRKIFEFLGVDEDAKYEILKFHSKALASLEEIGLSKVRREMLSRYADRLIGRTK